MEMSCFSKPVTFPPLCGFSCTHNHVRWSNTVCRLSAIALACSSTPSESAPVWPLPGCSIGSGVTSSKSPGQRGHHKWLWRHTNPRAQSLSTESSHHLALVAYGLVITRTFWFLKRNENTGYAQEVCQFFGNVNKLQTRKSNKITHTHTKTSTIFILHVASIKSASGWWSQSQQI